MGERTESISASLAPIRPGEFDEFAARRLLWRAGFGGTAAQVRTLAAWGPEKSVDHLLDRESLDAYPWPRGDEFDGDIMRPPTVEERRAYRRARERQDEDAVARFRAERQRRQRSDREQMQEVQRWWLKRLIETPRPLEEKMTLFWHGHFATSYRTIENSYHLFRQNQMFRRDGLGSYESLLRGVVRDPAMLAYLDNNESRKGRPNENLARELMELFSLGEGHYTERDIKEGARALTGYTFDHNDFVFREAWHDGGPKTILGATGNLDGEDFVAAILRSRACPEFIAGKLYGFFVRPLPEKGSPAYGPSRQVVRGLAGTLASRGYEIRPVLRRLLLSRHFYDPANRLARIKSPVELVVGAVRTLETPVRDMGVLIDAMDLMGQNIFFPPSVKGWDGGRSWINTSTLFVRQNVLMYLLTGKTPGGFDPMANEEKYDAVSFVRGLLEGDIRLMHDAERVVDALMAFMLGSEETGARRETLLAFVETNGGEITPEVALGLMCLITAMPEYQLC